GGSRELAGGARVHLAGQPGLPAGGGALVNGALRGCLVQVPSGLTEEVAGVRLAARRRGSNVLRLRLELGPDSLVPHSPAFVLPVALDLGLDVRSEGRRV